MVSAHGVAPECAVLAFHKTFSHPGGRNIALVPGRAHTKNLPAELLLMIFKLVYDEETQKPFFSDRREWVEKDLMSPSLFPYAIASVCSLWRDVISLVPEFWTRLVILIDCPSILPPEVISWSRDLPIDVTVTRKDSGNSVDRKREQTQAVSITKTLINPHIHRVRQLYFTVKFSSSLPPFPDGFDGDPRILRQLDLECWQDDGVSARLWETLSSADQQYPALENLLMDGRIFYHACKKNSRWSAKCPSVQFLSVSNFEPNRGESFSSSEFILPISNMLKLESLSIDNLVLVPEPSSSPPVTLTPLEDLNFIRLRHIHNFEPIAAIFGLFSGAYHFTFFHLAIGDPGRPFGDESGASLGLHYIRADQNLIPILRCWQGERLNVTACPSFNDAVLTLMGTETDDGGGFTCARNVTEIDITDCSNFSVAALRRFINNRIGTGSQIVTVCISGNAPPISAKDRRWLRKNLDAFDKL